MESKRSPLTCHHCGLEDPALKAFEPCRRCGRIYEPSPDEEPSSPVAIFNVHTSKWGWDPPYAVIFGLAAALLGMAYSLKYHFWGDDSDVGRIRYWGCLLWGSFCVVWLIAKWIYHLVVDQPGARQK